MKNWRNDVTPEVRAYLERLSYDGPLDGGARTLAELQEHHLHTVPYENLDILRGIPLSLEIQDLFEKIVIRRRGGYCFELNALFGWLLRELGYSVTDYMARFWRDEPNPPPKRRHHVLKVETDGAFYLCDVGVGGIVPRRPIEMVEGLEYREDAQCYRLEQDATYGWMLLELNNGQWRRLYSFAEEPQLPKDFVMPNYWCETAPDSPFSKHAMVAIRTHSGRNTVAGREFRIFTSNSVHSFIPETKKAYNEALRTYFGLVIDEI
ncbi:arylamine N-acetyltransferase family protein [Paenibacillus xerothermodurans]|uniref:Acetyltransferase n=1 Tax=Paenibacillus xerothermodurans TaxID=1977292 RepID=A0A2W1N8R4_PAEXE|nr:arylamine N-acetyltransferase [Paenibacillus xerothermodurans]PZE19521.1 acetyltransferase [Paenibacillus xerothermodurans]